MKIDNIKNKDIAEYINKSVDTVNGWKQRQPNLLEATRIGVFCKKNGLDIEKIKKLVEIREMVRDEK